MQPRRLLVTIGLSALLALAACEQSTTNPSGPGGYPGNGPGAGAGASSSSTSPMGSGAGSMSSGSSSNPMR